MREPELLNHNCMATHTKEQMREPRREHYIAPAVGTDTHAALDLALKELAAARDLGTTDPAGDLHLLASLAAEAESRFPELVADARRYGCSWASVADLLGVTRAQRLAVLGPKTPAPRRRDHVQATGTGEAHAQTGNKTEGHLNATPNGHCH